MARPSEEICHKFEQMAIPGLEPPALPKPKPLNIHQRIVNLEGRVLGLEMELTLYKIQRDKDHA